MNHLASTVERSALVLMTVIVIGCGGSKATSPPAGSGGDFGQAGAGASPGAGSGGAAVAPDGGGVGLPGGGGDANPPASTGGNNGLGAGGAPTGGSGAGGTGAAAGAGAGVTMAPDQPIDHDDAYPDHTELQYLSGTGTNDAVNWNFMVTGGRRAGEATTIPVPSNWEFQGFGTFRYGSGARTDEQGVYSRSFDVPATWAGRQIFIAFEGSMTDTTVTINGQSAGPVHQGAFYRFRYDITALVHVGATNQIQVTVAKESADTSVNDAERSADYWVFGGIFRPVYLEGYPRASIERFAANARADGSLSVDVFPRSLTEAGQVTARLFDAAMNPVGAPIVQPVTAGQAQVTLQGTFAGIKTWNAETPNRYRLAVELATAGGARHAVRENIGFRTIEVRAGDGIYVNGVKIMMKGVNRHSFWPESGRALTRQLSLTDIQLLKGMNVNAVRCSHYPPDRHFFEYADAMGLYVLDELAGWQTPPYATPVGHRLIQEMVTFDVNHPSIVFWDNGNEGGWNTALDGDFALWDPQRRTVLHPQMTFNNVGDSHYPNYTALTGALAGTSIYMTTEFLHGLYDGGAGAGLEDYWNAMRASPRSAGGFLWAFLDEGALRGDLNGMIDVAGNQAPDGIVGPYRQKEGSYYTIRQLWSPVRIAMTALPTGFTGAIAVQSDYKFLNLGTVTFNWQLMQFDARGTGAGHTTMAQGTATTGSIAPGASGTLTLALPASWSTADALQVDAIDGAGTQVGRWTWGIHTPAQVRASIVNSTSPAAPVATDAATTLTVAAGGATYTFAKASGQLSAVTAGGATYSLRNGPTLSSGTATLQSFAGAADGNDYVITVTYTGDMQQVLWRVQGNGWLGVTYRYALNGSFDHHGVTFQYPEAQVVGVDWLGHGPHRVYKNRMSGPWLDVWQREKNDAITGQVWDYPEFKGYFANLYWARLRTSEGPILFVVDTPDTFLRLYTPTDGTGAMTATAVYPAGDISFLQGISAMGDKFLAAAAHGPQSQRLVLNGMFEGTLYMHFGATVP